MELWTCPNFTNSPSNPSNHPSSSNSKNQFKQRGRVDKGQGITISSGPRMPNFTSSTMATSTGECGNLTSISPPPPSSPRVSGGGRETEKMDFSVSAPRWGGMGKENRERE